MDPVSITDEELTRFVEMVLAKYKIVEEPSAPPPAISGPLDDLLKD